MADINPTRRDLLVAIAALAATGGGALQAQQAVPATPAPSAGDASSDPRLLHSEIFAFDHLPVHPTPAGGASRPVIHGTLKTGEFVEVHETTLPPGEMPHKPHRHTHSEFLLIREGRLQVMSDGQEGVVEPGGVIFTASGVLHSLKNIGSVPANYFVVAIGEQHSIA